MSIQMSVKFTLKDREVKILARKVVGKSAFEIALVIEGDAKLLCARRYGYLAASIHSRMKDQKTQLESPTKYQREQPPEKHNVATFREIQGPTEENVALVGTAVDYGPHVEFGTKKMDAQPFLRPAGDMAFGKAPNIIREQSKYIFKDYVK
jgi:HK97 gp10 family phage protein